MSSAAVPAHGGLVLADRLVASRGLATNVVMVLSGVALVALLAQVAVPMWPVPITGQTLGVMVVGAALGAKRAAAAMTTYLFAGLAGLPIFAGGMGGLLAVTRPSFGFVLGFIPAAAFIGWLAQRQWDKRPLLSLAGFAGASIIPFLIGVPYMGMVLAALGQPSNFGTLITLGVLPFIIGGVIKWLLAAAMLPAAHRLAQLVDRDK